MLNEQLNTMAHKDFLFKEADFIEQYEAGNLINVYSNKWLKNNPEVCERFFETHKKGLHAESLGHFFILYLGGANIKLQEQLIKLIPSFKKILISDKHLPNFIFVNTITSQMLSIGLGRKNRLFIYDVLLGEFLNYDLSLCLKSIDIKNSIIREFCEFDYANIFLIISNSLNKLGEGYFYNEPKVVIENRGILKLFFPDLDTRVLNTKDF
jgi:hypothetical protein